MPTSAPSILALAACLAAILTLSGCEPGGGARYDPEMIAENDALRAASDAALQEEDAEAALTASEALLAHAETAFGANDSYTAIAWNERGNALSLAKREAEAAEAYERALTIEQGREQPNPAALTVTLGNLAETLGRLGRLNQAQEVAAAAVAQARAARPQRNDDGDGDGDLVWTLEIWGGVHTLNGAPAAAAEAYREALTLTPEEREADRLRLTALLGQRLFEAKQYDAALPHLEAAAALREKLEGADAAKLQYDLNWLGDVLAELGRPEEAEAAYLRDLAISQTAEGEDSLSVAVTQEDLGRLYSGTDRQEQAAAAFEQALKIRTEAQGADHPSLTFARHSLAHAYWALERTAEAAALFERDAAARAQAEDQSGAGHVWHDLGELRREAGEYSAARSAFGAALAARQAAHGDDNELTAVTKRALSDVEAALERTAEAEDPSGAAQETEETQGRETQAQETQGRRASQKQAPPPNPPPPLPKPPRRARNPLIKALNLLIHQKKQKHQINQRRRTSPPPHNRSNHRARRRRPRRPPPSLPPSPPPARPKSPLSAQPNSAPAQSPLPATRPPPPLPRPPLKRQKPRLPIRWRCGRRCKPRWSPATPLKPLFYQTNSPPSSPPPARTPPPPCAATPRSGAAGR